MGDSDKGEGSEQMASWQITTWILDLCKFARVVADQKMAAKGFQCC